MSFENVIFMAVGALLAFPFTIGLLCLLEIGKKCEDSKPSSKKQPRLWL